MTLKIKLLHPNARLPEYKTSGASGMDLYLCEDLDIGPCSSWCVDLGVAVEIPEGFEGQIRPRSSLSKRGVICQLGTIDSDYRGPISVVIENRDSDRHQHFEAGDRIAQLVIAPVARVDVVQVDELSETVRGGGGFGHTGR